MKPLTLFSWGSWGWGNSTRQWKEAVNAAETARGFEAPYFVDIRYRRSGRAPEFVGNYFRNVIGESNYQWEQRLGNPDIGSGPDITEDDRQTAAGELLDQAVICARREQRILFFCACVFPQWHRYPNKYEKLACHRDGVAELVCDLARKRAIDIEIVEWPGFEEDAEVEDLEVAPDLFKKLKSGRKSVPLSNEQVQQRGLGYFASLPWGTIATVRSGDEPLAVMTGPVKFDDGAWFLPVLERGKSAKQLKEAVIQFREDAGLNPRSATTGRKGKRRR